MVLAILISVNYGVLCEVTAPQPQQSAELAGQPASPPSSAPLLLALGFPTTADAFRSDSGASQNASAAGFVSLKEGLLRLRLWTVDTSELQPWSASWVRPESGE